MQENDLLLEILDNTKEIKTRLNNIEHIVTNHGKRLQNIEKSHGERLQNIENIVTRMEKEHGDKLQVLFDYFVDQDEKHKNIQADITNLKINLDNQNTRIFALEFYKNEKLASK